MRISLIILFFLIFLFLANPVLSQNWENQFPRSSGNVELYFCNYNDCEFGLIDAINKSENVSCAFYDLNIEKLIEILPNKKGVLVLDKKLEEDINFNSQTMQVIFKQQSAYMHHKFCILDNKKVLTGSMNPTNFGTNRNDNNFFIIESEILVDNYLSELNYLIGRTSFDNTNIFILNNFFMENYFCPRECDEGMDRVLNLINLSKKTIDIAAFSFTSEELFLAIMDAHERGVDIRVIMEKRMINGKSSKFNILQEYGIDIIFDTNPGSMHHKFIIIDGEVIETGSMNYSANAMNSNNENFFIIYSREIASAFLQEFERMWEKFS